MPLDDETSGDRLVQAFDLFEFGVEMMAANLRRRHPTARPAEIERMLDEWLIRSPNAEDFRRRSDLGEMTPR